MKILAFLVAVAAALLIVGGHPPVVTMTNQLVAILGWGLVMLLAPAPAPALDRGTLRAVAPLLIVFAISAAACTLAILNGSLPSSFGIAVLGIILLGGAVSLHGASAGASGDGGFARAFAIALFVCGLCSAVIAVMQVFFYDSLDNVIFAVPVRRGRAGGSIGQPNQFADTILWGLIAIVPLARTWQDEADGPRARLARAGWCAAALLMILGVVLCGTRTGLVALVLMAAWGVFDRRLARPLRIGLAASPLVAVAEQWAVSAWSHAHDVAVVLTDRSETDVTAHRGEIWGNCLALIKEQPWLGVGWGQFNFAWTLTPFPVRTAGLVTHAHNLPLQLAVELGVPIAAIMTGLLLWGFWKAARRAWTLAGTAGVSARATLMIVTVIGLHSMLEFPLWYVYLLLPTAWAFGLALGSGTQAAPVSGGADVVVPAPPLRAWRALGAMMVVISASAWLDYQNIVSLFEASGPALPLPERIQRAQMSPLFANQADYAYVTNTPLSPALMPAVQRASHVLLNGRLMYAWANLLHTRGEEDKARYMAARLREFDLSGPKPWYAPCDDPAVVAKPFQCLPPAHPVDWRDFR